MRSVSHFAFAAIAVSLTSSVIATPATATGSDRQFFAGASGAWSGPGEIIAGKYKGTKFVCNLTGENATATRFEIAGNCRVGVFNQAMNATIEVSKASYRGRFLDGAEGKGLDVVSGSVVSSQKAVFGLNRKQLKGALITNMNSDNTMIVTLSVKVEDRMIPVLGMSLTRVDTTAVGSVAAQ